MLKLSTMSNNSSNKSSDSSGSSTNLPYFHLDTKESSLSDLALYGNPAPTLQRTGTVRRVSAGAKKEQEIKAKEYPEEAARLFEKFSPEPIQPSTERTRRSLDSTYRRSLESIHEYKTTRSYSSSVSLLPNRDHSVDSSSSECTDYAERSGTEMTKEDKTLFTQSLSYLSWIESVNSEYFGSAINRTETVQDCDNKVGEWNNFWLNYNSARSKYMSSPYLSNSEDKTGDEFSEVKSTSSTQRDITDKYSNESVILTLDEITEAIRCSQRVTEILQSALKRNTEECADDTQSYYSQTFQSRQNSSIRELDVANIITRERSFSYAVDAQELQRQKSLLKAAPQSSSTSCINALLNTGVADILKRVIAKRREVMTSSEEPATGRSSFSEWSSPK